MHLHKIKVGVSAVALMLGLCYQAQAADLGGGLKDGYAGMPNDRHVLWRGFYAGVTVGGGSSTVIVEASGKDAEISQGHASVGAFAGYNFTSGPWVLGIEADIGGGGFDETKNKAGLGRVSVENWGVASVRARGGYAWNEFLFYGTAGVAFADYEIKSTAGGKATLSTGLAVGLGGEWAFAEKWTARLEGMVYAFGDDDVTFAGSKRDIGASESALRLGIARRF